MLVLEGSAAFNCLVLLLTNEYGYNQMNIYFKDYVYFQKNNSKPIQIDSLKENYSNVELSSYATQVDESVEEFISKFALLMKALEHLSKNK